MKDKHCTSDKKEKRNTHRERNTHKTAYLVSGFKSMRARIISLQFVCAVLTRSAVPGCLGVTGGKRVKEWEHGNACLYREMSTELSSGRWNKQSTSHRISAESLDKACQTGSDSTASTCINTPSCVSGLNAQTQIQCWKDVALLLPPPPTAMMLTTISAP